MRPAGAGVAVSYGRTYRIMRENGLVSPSATRSGKRKWARCERRYSNAMWHVDLHRMKDGRFRGLKPITYLDDASRCVTDAGPLQGACRPSGGLREEAALCAGHSPPPDPAAGFLGHGGHRSDQERRPRRVERDMDGSWTFDFHMLRLYNLVAR